MTALEVKAVVLIVKTNKDMNEKNRVVFFSEENGHK